jgi:hypothetical protein
VHTLNINNCGGISDVRLVHRATTLKLELGLGLGLGRL